MPPIRGELRSSVIIDPEDGRIPGTPAFKQWQLQVDWEKRATHRC